MVKDLSELFAELRPSYIYVRNEYIYVDNGYTSVVHFAVFGQHAQIYEV